MNYKLIIKQKIILLFFKDCLHCYYFDVIPKNNVSETFCIKYGKQVRVSDSCRNWRNIYD